MSEQRSKAEVEVAAILDGDTKEYPAEVIVSSGTSALVRFLDGIDSYQKYYRSWFLCDDDNIRPFIIENEHEGKSVLAKILGESYGENYYRGGYLESKKGQYGKIYVHQQKDPELFKRLTEYWNPSYNGTGDCRPKKEYVYNIIQRNAEIGPEGSGEVNFCKINKHTKLFRFGQKAFVALMKVKQGDGELWDYDVDYSKTGKSSNTVYTITKAGALILGNVIGPITEEEKAYERYDLNYITRLSSALYILKFLRSTLDRIDVVMGTSYVSELEKQSEIEREKYEQRKRDATAREIASHPEIPDPFRGVPAIPPNVSQNSRIPATSSVMMPCGHCMHQILDNSVTCPNCGKTLKAPCDVCKELFSVFETTCPYCGTKYSKAI